MTSRPLAELKNIGRTVASKLHELRIDSEAKLKEFGSAKAYKWLSRQHPEKRLPVCYYLYSLEGAIQNRHWDDFSETEKANLRRLADL